MLQLLGSHIIQLQCFNKSSHISACSMQGLDSNCPSCSVARDKDQRHAPEMNSLQQGPRSVMNRKETTSTDVSPRNNSEVADRLPVVVRFPASPRVRLKTVDPPKGNGLGQKKAKKPQRSKQGKRSEPQTKHPHKNHRICLRHEGNPTASSK